MIVHRTNLLGILLILGIADLQGQTIRSQQTQDQLFQRGVATKRNQAHLRFVSQPITTKPTQFFQQQQQQQQTQFRPQNSDLSPEQIRIVNEQNAFRKSVAQANSIRGQQFQQNTIPSQQEIPINQQQNFFDQNANNFNGPEEQTFQQSFSQQQTNEPTQQFQNGPTIEQNTHTFERITPQNQQGRALLKSRPNNQPLSIRRPINHPQHTTNFIATQPSRNLQEHTPESIIRSLTSNIQEPVQGSQDIPQNQNTEFARPEQSDFNIPIQRTNVKQRQRVKPSLENEESVREQAQNAKYSFASEVNDRINDHNHIRAETRDGLKLSGVYSYSDGYFKRTVHYEADENGYRIVKEDNEPIGDGPNTDPTGTADVSSSVGGANIQYSIRAEEVPGQVFTDRNRRSER